MEWIYLSPHLDDAALSCGGLIWEQAQAGIEVSIWTICAGDPPNEGLSPFAASLHARWRSGGQAVGQRRMEDIASCRILGAAHRHFALPDCIYRRSPATGEALYPSEGSLFGALHEQESRLVMDLATELGDNLPMRVVLVAPMAVGGHVDHRLTRAAVERLFAPPRPGRDWSLWYYADYPYVGAHPDELAQILHREDWEAHLFPISALGLQAWQQAVAAHVSQISTFWPSLDQMQAELAAYCRQSGGLRLWKPRRKSFEQAF